MTITRTITVAGGVFAPGHLGELTRIVPFELADGVLEETRTRERRLRVLPSRVGLLGAGLPVHVLGRAALGDHPGPAELGVQVLDVQRQQHLGSGRRFVEHATLALWIPRLFLRSVRERDHAR